MHRFQKSLTFILVLWAVVLAGPATALANGGSSAGDQQYVDPLSGNGNGNGGGNGNSGGGSGSGSPSSSSTAPSTSSSSTPATSASAGTSTTPVASTGTATTASSTASGRTLPFTGFNAWLAAALGLGLVGMGIVVRWRLASSRRG